jgi:[protein-PII] uridylyltransferase
MELVLNGRLALPARLAERARTYGRSRPTRSRHTVAAVAFDNSASAVATVIDVHAHDGVGVLYRMTRALAELDLDIRSARVQTLGSQVIDSFYVRDSRGAKVTDSHTLGEIERAILHGLGE